MDTHLWDRNVSHGLDWRCRICGLYTTSPDLDVPRKLRGVTWDQVDLDCNEAVIKFVLEL